MPMRPVCRFRLYGACLLALVLACLLPCLALASTAGAGIRSLTLGITVGCPYGLAA